MTETPLPRLLTAADLSQDPWNVMRGWLALDADVALLGAARDAAARVLFEIVVAAGRPGHSEQTLWLLDIARMSAIGRMAMLDTWRRARREGPPPGPADDIHVETATLGERSRYARVMRMRPEQLREVIAIVDGIADESR
jgi:hypothetical protein